MTLNQKLRTIIIPSICLGYILIRLWGVTASCLWFDEIFSVQAAGHSWDELFWFVAQDLIHPPLFYALLKVWIGVGGESVFWLRLFPVLLSTLAIGPFLMICKELKMKPPTVVVALSFFAVNGALIKYAQEVRMYSLLLFLSLVSIWLFSRFFIKGKSFATLVIVNILLVYTHYFGWFVVLSEVTAILVIQRIKILQTLLMFAIVLSSFIPWIVGVAQAAGSGADVKQNIGWIARPGLASFFDFIFDSVEPFYFQQSNAEPSSLLFISVPLLLLLGAAKFLYLLNWKNGTDRTGIYLLSIFIAVPVLLAFVASWVLPVSIWGGRHLIIVVVPVLLLAALFLTSINIKPVRVALISAVFAICTIAFVIRLRAPEPQFIWCAWEKMASELLIEEKNSTEPVKIYLFEDLVAYHFWFALRDSDKFQINVLKGMDGLAEDKAYFLPRGFDAVRTIDESGIDGNRIWIAFRGNGIDPGKPPLQNFISRGYRTAAQNVAHAGTTQAYIVLLEK